MVEVHMLPVAEGDFLWIRYGHDLYSNILIDGGPRNHGRKFKNVLTTIEQRGEKVDALILTHIDEDHIQGALEGMSQCSSSTLQKLIQGIYFNTCRGIRASSEHCTDEVGYAEDELSCKIPNGGFGVSHAVKFLDLLEQKGLRDVLHEFICAGQEIQIAGAKLRIISPGRKELDKLANQWEAYKNPVIETGFSPCPSKLLKKDITTLQKEPFSSDYSVNNRSSIAFLLEYDNCRMAFLGDAAASVCMNGLKKIGISKPYPVDFIKLSHHGSRSNTSNRLLKMLPTQNYLISTNGFTLKKQNTVPSKITISHLLRPEFISGNPVNVFANYRWWETTYHSKYFTENDDRDYLKPGLLNLIWIKKDHIYIKPGLKVCGENG